MIAPLPASRPPSGRIRRTLGLLGHGLLLLVLGLAATLAVPASAAAAPGPGPAVVSADPTSPVLARPGDGLLPIPRRCIGENDFVARPCHFLKRRPGAPTLVLVGDSHAMQVVAPIVRALKGKRINLVVAMQGGCIPMLTDLSKPKNRVGRTGCERMGHRTADWLAKRWRAKRDLRVVVAAGWELYASTTGRPKALDRRYPLITNDYIAHNARRSVQATPRLFRRLGRLGIPTDVVGPMPILYCPAEEYHSPAGCDSAPPCPTRAACDQPRAVALRDEGEHLRRLRNLLRVSGGGRLIRPSEDLCNASVCRGKVSGYPVYLDRLHIAQPSARTTWRRFSPTVRATGKLRR